MCECLVHLQDANCDLHLIHNLAEDLAHNTFLDISTLHWQLLTSDNETSVSMTSYITCTQYIGPAARSLCNGQQEPLLFQ